MIYIVRYKNPNENGIKLARVEADNYKDANERAIEVVNFINERLNQSNEVYGVTSLEALENWSIN